jgi:peptidyl-prolyl cis-trans isomerase B (cyclophilin B)
MSTKGKRRRAHPRPPEGELRPVTAAVRRPRTRTRKPEKRQRSWLPIAAVGAVALVGLGVLAVLAGWIPGFGAGVPAASPTPDAERPAIAPPAATPLANPPAEPAGDGTQVTLETELGNIVVDVFTDSSPVAAQNFVNLAAAGFYDGVVFHRIVPGFVIQGGDPEGTGGGGPGYTIPDDAVVGEYERGIVAMARPAGPGGQLIPDSQGSQFFIVLEDSVRQTLPKTGMYAIFGRVAAGMDVVDAIAGGPTDGQEALNPVAMTRVTVQRP